MAPEPTSTTAAPARRALVLFSGGQDSTTCLAWALENCARVETIGFDYGQRHLVEMECRRTVLARLRENFPAWARRLGDDHVLDLRQLGQISDTALTRDKAIEVTEGGLPSSFVPGRNLIFLTYAGAVAYRRGLNALIGGMCETDFSGYPDCRDHTMKAMQSALSLGMDTAMAIETPLMWLTKGQTWQLAERLGGPPLVRLIVEDTHTCYLGVRGQLHAWGHGCGECPACALRRRGFEAYVAQA